MKTGNSKLKATVLAAALAALALPALAQGPDLVLDFTNLEPLDASVEVYEGWAIVVGAPVSTGVFNVNAAGLTGLPALGAGWTYEGWVVDTSGGAPMPYSTGTFAMADGFDSDMAGPMGGGPAFPGQDFVAYQGGPVLDLASGDFAAVISIEPVPDNSPMPFQLKPLAGMIAQGAGDGCVGNQAMATFPSGHAELMNSVATEVSSWSGVKAVFE